MNRKSQNGVALVITLIMLAMVTVMAVLFLGISRRERASVTVTASLTDAKLAAEAGQARALSEVVARIAAQTNLSAYDYLVSTNYVNPKRFIRKYSRLMSWPVAPGSTRSAETLRTSTVSRARRL